MLRFNQKGKVNVNTYLVILIAVAILTSPILMGAATANVTYGTSHASQAVLDDLRSQMTDFIKIDTQQRQLKLVDLKINLVSNALNDNIVEAVFAIDKTTMLNYSKAEDVPALKGRLDFKNRNAVLLTSSDIIWANQDISNFKANLESYIHTPIDSHSTMKISGQLINGKIDPKSLSYFIQGPTNDTFFPYSTNEILTDNQVQQDAYNTMKSHFESKAEKKAALTKSGVVSPLISYNRTNASNYVQYYTSNH